MKVGFKARHGRRKRPVPHKPHRKGDASTDPLTRRRRAEVRLRKRGMEVPW